MLNKTTLVLIVAGVLLAITGCAAGPNTAAHVPDASGQVAGFWLGLWHGIIAPVTFVISLFTDSINCYDVHNNGWPYNLGFVIGIGCLGGGGGASAKCGKKKG